jgi:hypothetical protein
MIPFTGGIIALLESNGDEVPAHLQLVVDVFVDLLVGEELQDILLVSLDLVDDRDEEDKRDEE